MRDVAAADNWLKTRRRGVLLSLIGAAVVLRVVYVLQLAGGPCLWQHRWDQTDMSFFHNWALTIASGDWLTDRPLHPYHLWHHRVADEYFRAHPDMIEPYVRDAAAAGLTAPQLLWQRWYGGKRFHQEPLYPYLLAVTYKLFGPDVRVVFAWQLLLGIGSVVLIHLLARDLFGDTAGAVAGAMAVLCAPLMFYELVLVRAAPMAFVGLAAVYGTIRALEADSWKWWLTTGLALGLAVLLKSTFLLYVPGLLVMLAWAYRRRPAAGARAGGLVVAGVAACLVPLVARNLIVGVSPMSLSSVGAATFVLTNAEDWVSLPGVRPLAYGHMADIMGRTGGAFGAVVVETLRTHDGIGSVLGQLWGKFTTSIHWVELPNNTNLYFYSLYAPVLAIMVARFIVVAPLAAVGMVAAWRRFATCWPLYGMAAVGMAPLVAFGNLSRYRLVLLIMLIPFAALAVVRIVEWLSARRYAPAAAALATTAALALFIGRPLPPVVHRIRPSDYFAGHGFYYLPRAERAADPAEAAAIIAEALAYEPSDIRGLGPRQRAQTDYETQLAAGFSQLHLLCADYLERAGDLEAAGRHRARGRDLAAAAGS